MSLYQRNQDKAVESIACNLEKSDRSHAWLKEVQESMERQDDEDGYQ